MESQSKVKWYTSDMARLWHAAITINAWETNNMNTIKCIEMHSGVI